MADFRQKGLKNSHKRQANSASNSPDVDVFLSSTASASILDSLFISVFFKSSEMYMYFKEYMSKVDPSKFARHGTLNITG